MWTPSLLSFGSSLQGTLVKNVFLFGKLSFSQGKVCVSVSLGQETSLSNNNHKPFFSPFLTIETCYCNNWGQFHPFYLTFLHFITSFSCINSFHFNLFVIVCTCFPPHATLIALASAAIATILPFHSIKICFFFFLARSCMSLKSLTITKEYFASRAPKSLLISKTY